MTARGMLFGSLNLRTRGFSAQTEFAPVQGVLFCADRLILRAENPTPKGRVAGSSPAGVTNLFNTLRNAKKENRPAR